MAKDYRKQQAEEKSVEEAAPMSKADQIRASALPEHKKQEYLKMIGESKEVFDEKKVSFDVYAQVAGIKPAMKKALLVFPKAVGIKSATLEEWKEIFKDF